VESGLLVASTGSVARTRAGGRTLAALLITASVFAEDVMPAGVPLSRLVGPVAAVVALAAWVRSGGPALDRVVTTCIVAYAAWAAASGIWTTSPSGTASLLGSLAIAIAFAAAIAVLVRELEQVTAVLVALSLGSAMTAAIVVVAYLADPLARSGAGVGDPNFAAAYMILSLPAALVLAAAARTPALRLLFVVCAVLCILGVLATLSRGGLIALAVVLLLVAAAPSRLFFRSRGAKVAALLAVAAVGVVFTIAGAAGVARLESLGGDVGTGSGRLNEWRAAATAVDRHPWGGIGYGAFGDASNDLMRETPGVSFRDFELRPQGSEAHNTYLGTAAELGWLGLALLVSLLLAVAVRLWRTGVEARAAGDRAVERIAVAFLAGTVGWLVAIAFLSAETSRPIWIVAGLALALPTVLRHRRGLVGRARG
jgi:O-antigen ligase